MNSKTMQEELIRAAAASASAQRAPFIPRSLDNTALNDYMSCPRKYLYSMVLNRRRKAGGLSPALAYGTTWHAIMEAHYKTGGDRKAVVTAAVGSWQPHESPDDHRTLERALMEYEKYTARWGTHEQEILSWGRTLGWPENPMVEKVAELWWPGALHPYTGKIDRLIEHQGLVYVEDHKSGSQKPNFRQFDPSNQMMGYAWLAQKLTGLPIAGVRINAHAVLKTTSHFERQTIMYSQDRLEEWAENYGRWVQRVNDSMRLATLAVAPETQPTQLAIDAAFPMNLNACAGKYGMCTYTEVCTYPANIRGKILEAEYENEAWDPMADEEGEE